MGKKITCPSVLIHTNWSYDKNGILLAAMDEKDADHTHSLLKNDTFINVKSGHEFHFEKPKDFIKIMIDFKGKSKINNIEFILLSAISSRI
ncbi:hypothetical protein [Desulforamulus ruminis]|uniref:hypothetical protein n=1 Tax=Desulforamulus ruminis TaxID=1564 RepID=UPI0002E9D8F3|nr:hypothetical protein [Desulforamulus ruminis]